MPALFAVFAAIAVGFGVDALLTELGGLRLRRKRTFASWER